VGSEVATVVALARGRVLLVRQPHDALLALPGGRVERGESARAAAARVTLRPFALLDPPAPSRPPELRSQWLAPASLAGRALAAGVARSLHATLALANRAQAPPAALEAWWRERAGAYPWRETRDPWALLVCEVMSQQTQIERVRQRWTRWMERWPDAASVAAAGAAEVLREWDGLGYPRRALALHACARRVASEGWPDRLEELPGVGPYTADAIRCFAFEQPVLPRDANVRRVLARRFPGGVRGASWALGGALMDVGREHCRARRRCDGCPLARGCLVALDPSFDPVARGRHQARYEGSLRARRGAMLRAALAGERPAAASDPQAARSLVADGLAALRDGVLVEPAAIVEAGGWSS
jgi:A/G-specific adenine glycosylase